MNLCLLKSLWAWDFVCICVYVSVWVWGYACACVPSCEHCAFIIFNVIPESHWKAANEAHWVSGLQYFFSCCLLATSPPFYTLSSSLSRPGYVGKTTEMHQWWGDDRGTARRRGIGLLMKGIRLAWRKRAKFEETKEAKWAGMREEKGNRDKMWDMWWNRCQTESVLVKGLHDKECEIVTERRSKGGRD